MYKTNYIILLLRKKFNIFGDFFNIFIKQKTLTKSVKVLFGVDDEIRTHGLQSHNLTL